MKNITVSVDDLTYRQARIKAAQQDTSVSALVKRFLIDFAGDQGEGERLRREEHAIRERIKQFRAADRLPREKLYNRKS
jgi:hypothetical protein